MDTTRDSSFLADRNTQRLELLKECFHYRNDGSDTGNRFESKLEWKAIGIDSVRVLRKGWVVSIKSVISFDQDNYCLVTSGKINEHKYKVEATPCTSSIWENTSEELWVLRTNYQMTSVKVNGCL